MTLYDLGYRSELDAFITSNRLEEYSIGRIITEHKERYIIKTPDREYDAEILGNLRYTAQSRADFPAVGDWVAFMEFEANKALIHAILPRQSILARKAIGPKGEKQIIATNIDFAFLVQSVDRDFSLNRLERYMAICLTSNVTPIIILNKIDLVDTDTLNQLLAQVKNRIKNVSVFAISNNNGYGLDTLIKTIETGKTYCLLGSSGVGKSTLLNTISGETWMQTDDISTFSNRGKHVTTHRELRLLPQGGIMIDNPGMREVGIADANTGLEATFDLIVEMAATCKFSDCTHTNEKGCAIINAVNSGTLSASYYENYLKMEREKDHYESTIAIKRQKDKAFGKMVKQMKKIKNKK